MWLAKRMIYLNEAPTACKYDWLWEYHHFLKVLSSRTSDSNLEKLENKFQSAKTSSAIFFSLPKSSHRKRMEKGKWLRIYMWTQKYTVYGCLFIFTVKGLGQQRSLHWLWECTSAFQGDSVLILFVWCFVSGSHFCCNLVPLFPCMTKMSISSSPTDGTEFFCTSLYVHSREAVLL